MTREEFSIAVNQAPKARRARLSTLPAVGLIALFFAFFVACSGAESPADGSTPGDAAGPPRSERIAIVTTTTFLADWAQEIGGDRVEVFSLVPVGSDPHGFQPGARDVARVAEADIVLSIGESLEGAWLSELVTNAAASESHVIEVADWLELMPFGEGEDHDEDADHDEDHDDEDADHDEDHDDEDADHDEDHDDEDADHDEDHDDDETLIMMRTTTTKMPIMMRTTTTKMPIMMSMGTRGLILISGSTPILVQVVIDDIAETFATIDPAGAAEYQANATAYKAEIDELDAWIRVQTAAISEEDRLLVTSHDSLGYLARRYGFEVVGTVLGAGTADAEPSAEDLARLADLVNELEVRAVFGETTVTERLAASVAEESGARLVRLYSGSLGPEGSGADTWLGMMRVNIQRIVDGLSQGQ